MHYCNDLISDIEIEESRLRAVTSHEDILILRANLFSVMKPQHSLHQNKELCVFYVFPVIYTQSTYTGPTEN